MLITHGSDDSSQHVGARAISYKLLVLRRILFLLYPEFILYLAEPFLSGLVTLL
jgi:hypothetical protein